MCIIVIITVLGINAYYENLVEFLCIYFLNAPFIMYSFKIKMSHVCVGHEYTNKLDMWSVLYTESTNFVLYVENTTVFIWKCQVLSWWHSCKESFYNAGDTQETHIQLLCPDSLGEGNGNLLQYSCLGNLMDKGAWRATVHGVTKS